MGELDGKVAIVTGAGRLRGIGRAAAEALAELGADVVVTGTGRSPDSYPQDEKKAGWKDIESTAELVRGFGRRALALNLDVVDRRQVQDLVGRTVRGLGRVDILVNNAAFARGADRTPIVDLDPDIFPRVVDIKVTGTFLVTKAFITAAMAQGDGGKIVNISSNAGKTGSPNMLAYNAANFAMVGMTQSMGKELGPKGFNVNCVCPGAVETARMDVMDRSELDEVAARTPVRRNGTAEEVAQLIAYLCTEAASWIQGQSININGGTTMEH